VASGPSNASSLARCPPTRQPILPRSCFFFVFKVKASIRAESVSAVRMMYSAREINGLFPECWIDGLFSAPSCYRSVETPAL
jgi:hypothetical protein